MVKVLSDIITPKFVKTKRTVVITGNSVDRIVTMNYKKDGEEDEKLSSYIEIPSGYHGYKNAPEKSNSNMPTYREADLTENFKYKEGDLEIVGNVEKSGSHRKLVTHYDTKHRSRVVRTDEYYVDHEIMDDKIAKCYSMEFRYDESGNIEGALISASTMSRMTYFKPVTHSITEYTFIYDDNKGRISVVEKAESKSIEHFETAPTEMHHTYYTYWDDFEREVGSHYVNDNPWNNFCVDSYLPIQHDMTISIGRNGRSGLSTYWNGNGIISKDVVSIEVPKPDGRFRHHTELYHLDGYTPVLIDVRGNAMIIRYLKNELHEKGIMVSSRYDENEMAFHISLESSDIL